MSDQGRRVEGGMKRGVIEGIYHHAWRKAVFDEAKKPHIFQPS